MRYGLRVGVVLGKLEYGCGFVGGKGEVVERARRELGVGVLVEGVVREGRTEVGMAEGEGMRDGDRDAAPMLDSTAAQPTMSRRFGPRDAKRPLPIGAEEALVKWERFVQSWVDGNTVQGGVQTPQ